MDKRNGKKRLPPFSHFQNNCMSEEDIKACLEWELPPKLPDLEVGKKWKKSEAVKEGGSSSGHVVNHQLAKQMDVLGKKKQVEEIPVVKKIWIYDNQQFDFNPNPEEDYDPEVLKDAWNYEEEEEVWSCVWHNPYSGEVSDSELSSRGDCHWK
ncbi:hypothetical protein Hanom_Chr09g00768051 [Helianthus anomalus]